MKLLPEWQWPTLFFVQTTVAAIAGLLTGIVSASFTKILIGVILYPISNGILLTLTSGFFYYFFLLFLKEQKKLKRIFTCCFFASIPLLALNIAAQKIAPLYILGLFVSSLLLIVGFVENLRLPKNIIKKIVFSLFAINTVFWIAQQINYAHKKETQRFKTTPESLDILEREIKSSDK